MISDIILFFYFLGWYSLIVVVFLFSVSGIDDLFFDIYYWTRFTWRLWKTRKYPKLTYEKLKQTPEKKLAVLLPCWHEAGVIGTMLTHNCYAIEYQNYDIFVGVYPNDPETVAAVKRAETLGHVRCVVGEKPGPTNKAANLNQVYRYILQYEKEHNTKYEIFVFHDSEDIIHPLSFKLYNYLIPRKDMVQIPVFPLEVTYFNFTHWLYNDEFCEIHTKDIIVRESIQGLVPSAGVGTGFSRKALEILSKENNGVPFATYSLTEDYKTALNIRIKGLSQIFVAQTILRTKWKKRWYFWGEYRQVRVKEYIATRALFPMEYIKAVRQKARWIMGISLQEWAHTGWVGNFTTRYTLLHDRKSVFTHFVSAAGYFLFIFWSLYYWLTHEFPQFPSLQEQFNLHPWVWYMVLFVTFLMFERMLQRCIATWRIYGFVPALLAPLRVVYGNILNLHALLRAYRLYFFAPKPKGGKAPAWDKTEHHFPGSHVLIPIKKRLGDLMIQENFVTTEQLENAIAEQRITGEPIGNILQKHHYVNQAQLMQVLAKQYQLPLEHLSDLKILPHSKTPGISWYNRLWLKNYHCYPVAFNAKKKTITIAIPDPSNEKLINQILSHMKPYEPDFILYTRFKKLK